MTRWAVVWLFIGMFQALIAMLCVIGGDRPMTYYPFPTLSSLGSFMISAGMCARGKDDED